MLSSWTTFLLFIQLAFPARDGATRALPLLVKFIYSKKATKFCEIFTLLLTTVHTVKRWRFRKILWPSQRIWTLTRFQNCFGPLVPTEQKLVLFWQTDCSKTCLGIPRRIKPHKFQLLLAEESPSAPPHTSKTAFLGENVAFLSTI